MLSAPGGLGVRFLGVNLDCGLGNERHAPDERFFCCARRGVGRWEQFRYEAVRFERNEFAARVKSVPRYGPRVRTTSKRAQSVFWLGQRRLREQAAPPLAGRTESGTQRLYPGRDTLGDCADNEPVFADGEMVV